MEISILDYLRILWRRRYIIAGFVIIAAVTSYVASKLTPKIYEAQAKILVVDNKASAFNILSEIGGMPRNQVQNYVEALKGGGLAREVQKRLGRPIDRESLKKLASNLTVEPIAATDAIAIRVRDRDPLMAQRLANTYVNSLRDLTLRNNQEDARRARLFIENQLSTMNRRLARAEQTLNSYQKTSRSISPSDEAKLLINKVAEMETRRASLEVEMEGSRARLAQIQEELSTEERTMIQSRVLARNPVYERYRERLAQLNTELTALLAEYTEKHPKVIAKKAEIAKVQEDLGREMETTVQSMTESVNPIHQSQLQEALSLQAGVMAQRAAHSALAKEIDRLDAKLGAFPDEELQLARLTREKVSVESIYTMLLAKKSEIEITEQMQTADIRRMESAYRPYEPVLPKTKLNVALAMVMGFLVSATLALVLERMDPSLKTRDEAEKSLEISVFGMIPGDPVFTEPKKAKGRGEEDRQRERLIVDQAPKSPLAEAYRVLRMNIQFTGLDKPLGLLMLTSAGPKEGKSTTTANLGVALAQSGQKVILVDGDLRRPTLHKFFGLHRATGLSAVLLGRAKLDEALLETGIANLRLLPCGAIPPNPSEMLSSQAFRNLLDELRREADLVIIDGPPVIAVADASLIASRVDGVLLVVGLGIAAKPMAIRAKEQLEKVNGHVLGMILTNVGPGTDYSYHYYYYGYGQ